MDSVDVSLLLELLLEDNTDLEARVVRTELASALNGAGYPFTTRQVGTGDAAAMLDELDRGVVRSSPELRAAVREGRLPAR